MPDEPDACPALRIFLTAEYDAREGDVAPAEVARRLDTLARITRPVLALAGELPTGARVLDVGTGSGLFALAAARAWPRAEVVGVDLSPRAVEAASAAARHLGLANARFEPADALALPFPDARFDLVLTGFALNLVPSKARALAEAARLAGAGARVVVAETLSDAAPHEDGPGPISRAQWDALASGAGLAPAGSRDVTEEVLALRASNAWPWGANVADGYRYLVLAYEAGVSKSGSKNRKNPNRGS